MRQVLLAVAAGAMTGNALPHFIKGITAEPYPTVFGDLPMTNLVAGSSGLLLSAWLARRAADGPGRASPIAAGTIGLLVAGIYHARGGPARLNVLLGR